MLKKFHLRLTLLCTFITGLILLSMTVFYLYISESNLKENHFMSFQNNVKNILSGLENTDVITEYYLSLLEADGRYDVFVEDNGVPLLYGTIQKDEQYERRRKLLDEIKNYIEEHYELETSEKFSSLAGFMSSFHVEFIYETQGQQGKKAAYYVCAAALPKKQGSLSAYILSSTDGFYEQLRRQRVYFGAGSCLALSLLYVFFYFFTAYLLRPIRENQEKQGSFIASASHELRTPLSVILSSVSLLQKCEDAEKQKLLDTITQEGLLMKRLLEEMLMLAGTDSHTLKIEKKPAELDTLMLECAEAFEPLAEEKNLSIEVKLPEEELRPCLCDAQRIRQVLSILLHNAISYTPEGGCITLSVSEKERKHFELSVADSGIGISDADKKSIFERFYRVDPAHSKKEHFGLGLSIALEIIKEHKGSIQVLDTPGGGATFLIRL